MTIMLLIIFCLFHYINLNIRMIVIEKVCGCVCVYIYTCVYIYAIVEKYTYHYLCGELMSMILIKYIMYLLHFRLR